MSLEKKHFGNGGNFRNYCFFLAPFIVDRARCKWTGRRAVEVNTENKRFTVVCSRCRKFRNFTLSFGRLRQRIVLKCVPHVQHDYFSSFNQLDHCFLASSLPLPSTLLKLPIRELKQPRRRRQQKPHKFAYLTMKNRIFARFARAYFIF